MNKTWEEAILSAMIKLGGQNISLQDIYAEMENHPPVTQYHKEAWQPGLQPRYQCWIRSYLHKMKRKGIIKQVSKGVYSVIA